MKWKLNQGRSKSSVFHRKKCVYVYDSFKSERYPQETYASWFVPSMIVSPCHENQCLKAVCFKSSKPMVFCVFFHVYHHNIKSVLCNLIITDIGLFEYRVAPNLTLYHHFPWENNYLGVPIPHFQTHPAGPSNMVSRH